MVLGCTNTRRRGMSPGTLNQEILKPRSMSSNHITRSWCTATAQKPPLPLHAHDLTQRVHDLDQVGLRGHDGVEVFVGHGSFVDDGGVFAV